MRLRASIFLRKRNLAEGNDKGKKTYAKALRKENTFTTWDASRSDYRRLYREALKPVKGPRVGRGISLYFWTEVGIEERPRAAEEQIRGKTNLAAAGAAHT